MKKFNFNSKKELVIGIVLVIALLIISIILFNETSLRLTGVAIILFAIILKMFVINNLFKK